MIRSHRVPAVVTVSAVLLCLCAVTALAATAAAAAAPSSGDVDFGAQFVQEAVDLNAAHSEQQEPDAKEMESLLHWAIGEVPLTWSCRPTKHSQTAKQKLHEHVHVCSSSRAHWHLQHSILACDSATHCALRLQSTAIQIS